MELKPYQKQIIQDLHEYLSALVEEKRLRQAFSRFWKSQKDIFPPEAYKDTISGVPHVCVKVPTGGGKTFVAAHALKTIFDAFAPYQPNSPKAVIWLVPSRTILDQTLINLKNPRHPYRQQLNADFAGRVEIYTKEELLQGAGFNPVSIDAQLSIFVFSFDTFRSKSKDNRKIYQENGQLLNFAELPKPADCVLENTDETALINVLRFLNPVLIVDESHNAESQLSVEMLGNLNPRFILDLTATPRNNSNIISYVSAAALKKENMVKLPVIVHNHPDKTEVIHSALQLQRHLEAIAKQESKNSGAAYLRPIVLFQAQPKTRDDNETFEKIKHKLLQLHIPEEQIKIKTAAVNELKNIDLFSPQCPVRYIITVNALKEGWDCSFAYILASLADKTSPIDVEQIVGRILRQPHAQKHPQNLLNSCYVLTASSKFMDTLDSIVAGLNQAGFSRKDCRVAEALEIMPTPAPPALLFPPHAPESENEIDVERILTGLQETPEISGTALAQITKNAQEAQAQYSQENQPAFGLPLELEKTVPKYRIRSSLKPQAEAIVLPQFFYKAPLSALFGDSDGVELSKANLLKEFKISYCDINLSLDNVVGDFYKVDIVQDRDDQLEYLKLDKKTSSALAELISGKPRESQIRTIASTLVSYIKFDAISDSDLKMYTQRILETLSAEQLKECAQYPLSYASRIKQKIVELTTDYARGKFSDYLKVDDVYLKPNYHLPEYIIAADTAPAITKSLYEQEAKINDFERMVINEIANLDNIQFWHRNQEKKGFCLNGFINHYPDFIVKTQKGKVLLIESKGDFYDGSDSLHKIELGQKWEARAGNHFRYMMVFENKAAPGAYKLQDALRLIEQL